MQEIIELEICSQPGENIDAESGKDLELLLISELGLNEDMVIGLSFFPEKAHVDNLLIAINEGELNVDAFSSYCRSHNLNTSIHDKRSAAYYLEYEYGRTLAWLHIPNNENSISILEKILLWCMQHKYNVQNGDDLYCLLPNL